MCNNLKVLAAVAAMTLAGTGARAAQDQQPGAATDSGQAQQSTQGQPAQGDPSQQGQPGSQQQQQAPDGFVLIQERIVFLMGNAPQQHLLASLEKMHQDNPRAAVGEIRQAAAYVEMQASRAKGEGQQALNRAAEQLNQVARKVAQEDKSVSPEQLSRAFAQTGQALAKHHQVLAQRALEKDRHLQAGYELEASAHALKQALIWSGQQPQQETIGTLQNALAVAYELRNEKMPADPKQQQQQQGRGTQEQGEAQPALARQPAETPGDPRTGTTRAEGQNVQQHATQLLQELEKDIQQLGNKIRQSDGSTDGASEPDRSRQDQPGQQPQGQQQQQESRSPQEQSR